MSRIDDEATAWVARLNRDKNGDRDANLLAQFQAWHDAHPRHAGAFLRAEAAWTLLDRAGVMSHGDAGVADRALNTRVTSHHRAVTRRYVLGAGMAASVAGAAAIAMTLASRPSFTTGVGELRSIPLHDRSVAEVNTDSHIDVDMNATLRHVALVKGEAWFAVAKNPDAPFVVSAGDIRVRAVGTAFSVRKHQDGADVLVTEGTVEAWNVHDISRRVTLTAGHEAFVPAATSPDKDAVAVSYQPDEVTRRLAWREREIILKSETLAEAAAEFNRYNTRQIVINDPALAGERLVGGFHVDQPDTFARAVHAALNAPVAISDDRIIIGTPDPAV